METSTMGSVLVTAKIESLEDLYQVERGSLPADQVRRVEVKDALVDTGATILSMPKRLIDQLGLRPVRTRRARSSAGPVTLQVYGAVRLTVEGRDCLSDVAGSAPERCPALIGQIPLELLDFVVDPVGRRTGNPVHGGEHMLDMFRGGAVTSRQSPPAPGTASPARTPGTPPPPVETCVIFSARRPNSSTASAVSPPPTIVTPFDPAIASATACVPLLYGSSSNLPSGPFHTTVAAFRTAAVYSAIVFRADIDADPAVGDLALHDAGRPRASIFSTIR